MSECSLSLTLLLDPMQACDLYHPLQACSWRQGVVQGADLTHQTDCRAGRQAQQVSFWEGGEERQEHKQMRTGEQEGGEGGDEGGRRGSQGVHWLRHTDTGKAGEGDTVKPRPTQRASFSPPLPSPIPVPTPTPCHGSHISPLFPSLSSVCITNQSQHLPRGLCDHPRPRRPALPATSP